jgi:hypothetical protein
VADNYQITAGAGTTIATDDVGGAHYHRVKLDGGGDGASAPVTATANGEVNVQPAKMTTLASTTWDNTTPVNTTVAINTEGYRTLRIILTTNTASSGALQLLRDSSQEQFPFYLTDNSITDGWIRLRQYVFFGTVGDVYVDTGGASVIRMKLAFAIGSGSVTLVPALSPTPWERGFVGLKSEDEPSVNFDFGMPAMAVRKATPANTSGSDGDYEMLQMSNGRLYVDASGNVAHDAADSGNPVKVGGRARTSDVTAVASNDRTDFITDTLGKQVVRSHCIPEQQVSGVASATGTGNTAVIAAQGAGVRTYLTNISVANASTTNAIIEIKDGTTVKWRMAAPGGGGSDITFDPPLQGSANTAWNFAALTGVTTAYCSASGYKGV